MISILRTVSLFRHLLLIFFIYLKGTSWGDPHFVTLDKKEFTFNGLGEYELIHLDTSGKEFALQARTSRPTKNDGTLSYATSFTAFAAKDHTNASFHVELNKAKDGIYI